MIDDSLTQNNTFSPTSDHFNKNNFILSVSHTPCCAISTAAPLTIDVDYV